MKPAINPGEFRQRIRIENTPVGDDAVDDDGYREEEWKNVHPKGGTYGCRWVNAHGRDVLDAKQLGLEELATLTMRYTERLTPTCRIFRGDDPRPYDVISIDNIREMGRYLEIKVQRKVQSQ